MARYLVARLAGIIPTILVLVFLVVTLLRLIPGNAVDRLLVEQPLARDASREEIEHHLGLDQSVPEAYGRFVAGLLTGDLGRSLYSQRPVTEIILRPLGVTLEFVVLAMALAVSIGVPVGILSAIVRGSPLDYAARSLSILGLSIPNFAIATCVLVLPALWWGWSPPLVYVPPSEGFIRHISQFLAPAAVLALALSATIMRLTRAVMIEVLAQDYIRTARAKGIAGRTVIVRHAVRNALIPVVSLMGLQVAYLVSGAVILENVFALPGLGRTLIDGVVTRDYPIVQGITVVAGVLVILVNLSVDLSYRLLDPRIKFT